MKLHVKKGDFVKVISGSHKGKIGKVVRTDAAKQMVFVDGIGLVKRKVKPSQLNPRGGTKEIHVGLSAGKVAVTDEKPTTKTAKSSSKKTGKEK